MVPKLRNTLVLLVAGLLALCQLLQAAETKESLAVTASKAWLALVDKGLYSKSWEEASQYFKTAVSQEKWKESMSSFRAPLGKLLSRKLKSSQYAKTLPGAPDGEYVVIQYETSFEKKGSAIETVTPMLDKDGKWRVTGYYIR